MRTISPVGISMPRMRLTCAGASSMVRNGCWPGYRSPMTGTPAPPPSSAIRWAARAAAFTVNSGSTRRPNRVLDSLTSPSRREVRRTLRK